MSIFYINSEEDLKDYNFDRQTEGVRLPSVFNGLKNKDIKFVFSGAITLKDGMMQDFLGLLWSLTDLGYNISVDIQLNQNNDSSTIMRKDLISKDMGYFIYSLPSNISSKCIFKKADGSERVIDAKYFARNWQGRFILDEKEEFDDEFKEFIDDIKNNNYDNEVNCQSINEILLNIEKIKSFNGKTKFVINLEKAEYNENFLRVVSTLIEQAKLNNKEIDVVIDAADLKIDAGIAKILLQDEKFNSYQGVSILYGGEFGDTYTGEELLSAMAKVKLFVDEIKKSNASPFEKYLIIYRYVTNHVYIQNEETRGKTRDLISILNDNDIVCAGYANLLKWICNEVGIACETQSVISDGEPHRNNRVYIKDEKYGIDGWYYADSTWDCIKYTQSSEYKYSYCLVPISDVKYLDGIMQFANDEDALGVLYENIEEFVDIRRFMNTSYFVSEKFIEEIKTQHKTISEEEAKEKIDEAIDVVERIMKKNSIGPYVFEIDEYGIGNRSKFFGGLNKYILLYATGCFSEEMIECIMLKASELSGPKVKENYEQRKKVRHESEIRNFDVVTKGNLEEHEEDIKIAEDDLNQLKIKNPQDPKIKEIEQFIHDAKIWIENYKIKRQAEREKLLKKQGEEYVIDRGMVFRELKKFMCENYFDWQIVNEIFRQMSKGSKPVPLEKFHMALIESYIAQGFSRRDAEKKAQEEIERTQEKTIGRFKEGATNCFAQNSATGGSMSSGFVSN